MVCQICMQNTAIYHVPKIVNNEIVFIHLCRDCADQNHSHEITNGIDDKLHYLLEGLIRSKDSDKSSLSQPKCGVCGTSLKDLKKNKPLGCAHCYDTFSNYLSKELNLTGPEYFKHRFSDKIAGKINRMKKELKKAIESEDFEKAALLRDKILNFGKENFFHEDR
jgi:protein arginine kinase activator